MEHRNANLKDTLSRWMEDNEIDDLKTDKGKLEYNVRHSKVGLSKEDPKDYELIINLLNLMDASVIFKSLESSRSIIVFL